jgi:hypothetical protein
MLAATLIAIFLIPVMFYVIARFAASRRRRTLNAMFAGETQARPT